jgi:uncharacterized protein (TIGR02265 family)
MSQEETKPKPTISYGSVEATLRGSGAIDNPEVLRRLKAEAGFDMLKPKPSYDWSLVKLQEQIIPQLLGWQGTRAELLFRLGCCTFVGWGESIMGRVLTAPIGKATPARALELMSKNMSLSPAFGTHELKKLGSTQYIFIGQDDIREPEFIAGLMFPVLEKTGATEARWSVRRTATQAYEINFSWVNLPEAIP